MRGMRGLAWTRCSLSAGSVLEEMRHGSTKKSRKEVYLENPFRELPLPGAYKWKRRLACTENVSINTTILSQCDSGQ